MQTIQWGIIGCGDVTELKSGPAFSKVPQSRLIAVMRRNRAKAEDFARRHNVPKWYDDANALINDPHINAIYVATPPSTHEEFTLAAFRAGKPVYLEKPMTTDYTSANRLASAAEEMNQKLVVAHYRREQPLFRKIRQLIMEKAIGDPLYVRLELAKPPLTAEELMDEKIRWRVDPSIAGGGLFHDLSPHQLDLMYYFFGPVEKAMGVSAIQSKQYNAADMVAGILLFKSGVAFTGSWCFNVFPDQVADLCEITGTHGRISFSFFSGLTIRVQTAGSDTTLSFDPLQHVQQPMIEATVRHFLNEAPNPCSGKEGAEIMRLIDTIANGKI